jgi:hypothetical protein
MKTEKELLKFAKKINNKLYELHGFCYSEKSNDIFDLENDSLIYQIECFNEHLLSELIDDIQNDCVNNEGYEKELNQNWKMCQQIEKYFNAVTNTPRPGYIYG